MIYPKWKKIGGRSAGGNCIPSAVLSVGGRPFILPITDHWADPLEAHTSGALWASSMHARAQTLTKRNLLTTHGVEAWLEDKSGNRGLELGAQSRFHSRGELKLFWYCHVEELGVLIGGNWSHVEVRWYKGSQPAGKKVAHATVVYASIFKLYRKKITHMLLKGISQLL